MEKNLQKISERYDDKRSFSGHYSIKMYDECTFNDYTVFGVVRNPYDRIYSCYNYLVKCKWHARKFPETYRKLSKPQNFTEFINNLYDLYKNNDLPWLKNEDMIVTSIFCNTTSTAKILLPHIFPQHMFLSEDTDYSINILKYESLDHDLTAFNDKYFSQTDLHKDFVEIIKKVKIKKSYDVQAMYPDIAWKIKEIYNKDFKLFGYDT